MTSVASDDQLRRLMEDLAELQRKRAEIAEMERYLPTVQTIRSARIVAKLLELIARVAPEFWAALALFLQCKSEELYKLEIDQLRDLVDAMIAGVELQIETVDGPARDELRKALQDELLPLKDVIAADDSKDEIVKAIVATKEQLKKFYQEVFVILGLLFSLELSEELGKAGEQAAGALAQRKAGAAIKAALRKAILTIIARRASKEVAKRAVPYVGLALTLAEASALGFMRNEVADIDAAVCALMCEVLNEVLTRDWGWTDQVFDVWADRTTTSPADFGSVTVRAYVRCHRIVDGKCVWDVVGCPVRFDNDQESLQFYFNGASMNDVSADGTTFEWPVVVNQDDVDNCECCKGANKCALFLRLSIRIGDFSDPKHPKYRDGGSGDYLVAATSYAP